MRRVKHKTAFYATIKSNRSSADNYDGDITFYVTDSSGQFIADCQVSTADITGDDWPEVDQYFFETDSHGALGDFTESMIEEEPGYGWDYGIAAECTSAASVNSISSLGRSKHTLCV